MSKLFIHAGAHKTGTTSVQQAFAGSREALKAQGFYYPDSRPWLGGGSAAHHRLAHALTGTDPEALDAAGRFIEHLESDTADGGILLSAEAFWRHLHGLDAWTAPGYWNQRARYLDTVATALAYFERTVIVALRRQDLYAESLYKEAIGKDFYRGPFARFLGDWADLFNFDRHVTMFDSRLGATRVLSWHDGPAPAAIASSVGVALPDDAATTWERRSPDPRLTLWMAERDPAERKRQREFAMSAAAARLFPHDGATLWPSQEVRERFLNSFDGPLGAGWFPIPDDLGPMAKLTDHDRDRLDASFHAWETAGRSRSVN